MENATKGLTMAGSILIGIIVMSLFVYMISNMGSITKNFQEDMDSSDVQKFNVVFEKYIGKEDLTSYDLLTVYNLVLDINEKAGYQMIEVKGITTTDFKNLSNFLSNDKRYKCDPKNVTYSKETQKITYIEFTEVKKTG